MIKFSSGAKLDYLALVDRFPLGTEVKHLAINSRLGNVVGHKYQGGTLCLLVQLDGAVGTIATIEAHVKKLS